MTAATVYQNATTNGSNLTYTIEPLEQSCCGDNGDCSIVNGGENLGFLSMTHADCVQGVAIRAAAAIEAGADPSSIVGYMQFSREGTGDNGLNSGSCHWVAPTQKVDGPKIVSATQE